MAINYSPKISTNGLVLCLDPLNLSKHGASPYANLSGTGSIANSNFQEIDGVWRSNANAVTGEGTSFLSMTGFEVNTGSFTMIIWLKRTSEPNVGSNNNWRSVFMNGGTNQNPFGILMEQYNFIQFTLATSVSSYRHLGGQFTQFFIPLNTWTQVVFAYNSASATGFSYQNGALVRSGNMSTTADQSVSAAPGEGVGAITTGFTYRISNSNVANNNGAGCFPGDIGPASIYNRSLTAGEVFENFQALRGRYGI